MQTEQDFWAEFDQAQRNYITLRAAKGFPLVKPEANAPLPAWVLRNNERPKMTFVTRSPAPAQTKSDIVREYAKANDIEVVSIPLVKPVEAAVEAKPAAGQSFAAQVRAVIADVKPKGWTQEQVVEHAITVLGMKRTSALNCVKHNWDRVK